MSSDVIDEDDAENNESLMAADNRLFPSSFDYFDYNQGVSNLAIQGLGNQGLVNQGFANQGLANQGLANLGLANQGLANQGLTNQGLANQGLTNQGLANQGLANQGLAIQDLANQGLLGTNILVNQNLLNNQNALLNQQQQILKNKVYNDYGNYDYAVGLPYYTLGAYGGAYCREDQVNIGILLVTLAGISLMFYTLLTKIQANGGRHLLPPSLFSINVFDNIQQSKFTNNI